MLIRLFGKNFRSLRDEFQLSMVAADLKSKKDVDRGVIEVDIGDSKPLRLLRAVAIFGANASGKSTIITAASALHWLVSSSSRQSEPDQPIPPYEPFLLDDETAQAPITLGCDVVHDNSILHYEIEYVEKEILREQLELLRPDKETVLIDRQGSESISGELIDKSEANQLYVQDMQPNVLALSKLAQHGPAKGSNSVRPYFRAVQNATQHKDFSDQGLNLKHLEKFADDKSYREWVMENMIKPADFGICNVKIEREDADFPNYIKELAARSKGELNLPEQNVIVSFNHSGANGRLMKFHYESQGTRKHFSIAHHWWSLAHEPITHHVDELGASLHPKLLDRLIRIVNAPPSKEVNSQLIFTAHAVGLLESQDGRPPALRRDQVYFTKKNADGATELYSLAEFKDDARTVHNIRKRYLSGLYGAIPSVEQVSL